MEWIFLNELTSLPSNKLHTVRLLQGQTKGRFGVRLSTDAGEMLG